MVVSPGTRQPCDGDILRVNVCWFIGHFILHVVTSLPLESFILLHLERLLVQVQGLETPKYKVKKVLGTAKRCTPLLAVP